MDYRKATTEDYRNRLNALQDVNIMASRDTFDAAKCASDWLNLRRCGICLRLTNAGYFCTHCGKDDSCEYDD